jgi:type II pantothenate kinase
MILKKEKYEHIGGSALGGGFFMAFIKLLYNMTDYDHAIKLASKGNRYNVDLKVGDIYSPDDSRIDAVFRQFTAASFGKINDSETVYDEADLLNSVICLIGENIGTIAIERVNLHNVKNLIFCGGFLKNNKPLRQILKLMCSINKKKAIYLEHSMFTGAIGSLNL